MGLDISPGTFPPESSWPRNVTIRIQDMMPPFPDEVLGTYDDVAIRFVSGATTRTESGRAIENLVTLYTRLSLYNWEETVIWKYYKCVL
jgi:hypothetical protein